MGNNYLHHGDDRLFGVGERRFTAYTQDLLVVHHTAKAFMRWVISQAMPTLTLKLIG